MRFFTKFCFFLIGLIILSCSDTVTNIDIPKKYHIIPMKIGAKLVYNYTYSTIGKINDFDTVCVTRIDTLFSVINNKWLPVYKIDNPIDNFNGFYELDSILYKGWIVKDTLMKEIIKLNIYDLTKSSTDYTSYKNVSYYKGQKPYLGSKYAQFPTAYYFEELMNNKYYTSVYVDSIGLVYYQELNYSNGTILKEYILHNVIK